MLFNSYEFVFVFLPVALAGVYFIRSRSREAAVLTWLIACSLVFYAWWYLPHLALLLASILFNYGLGLWLLRRRGLAARWALAFGIAVNLGLIAVFKYADFFIGNVNLAIGAGFDLPGLALPLAISFFTFQQIAFLVDIHRGVLRHVSFLRYALFVSFFPQLIAGPIVHYEQVAPQFAIAGRRHALVRNLAAGLAIFTIGLLKKVGVADQLAPYADAAFDAADQGTQLSFIAAWAGAVCYSLQLYFDFSGYSDMAVGLARCIGVRLPINFNAPYKATSIIDFWSRWHMTLSRFLRDYLYIPLGGSRRGGMRRHLNIAVTMLLGGLWHGASWNFVLWGGLHGIMISLNHLLRRVTGGPIPRGGAASWIARAVTFGCVVIAWVPFRAETWQGAAGMLKAMAGANGVVLPPRYAAFDPAGLLAGLGVRFDAVQSFGGVGQLAWILVGLVLVWACPTTVQLVRGYGRRAGAALAVPRSDRVWRLAHWRPGAMFGIVLGLAMLICAVLMSQPNRFLYFQF